MNSEIEIKLRRLRHNLAIGGRLYIIFGVWNVIKMVMMMTMGDDTRQFIDEVIAEGEVTETVLIISLAIIILLFSFFIMITHLMVGRNAVRFSRGEKNRKRFYFYTIIVAIINVIGLISYPVSVVYGVENVDEVLFASFLVDISITFILIDLFCSAIKIEKLDKVKAAEGEVA